MDNGKFIVEKKTAWIYNLISHDLFNFIITYLNIICNCERDHIIINCNHCTCPLTWHLKKQCLSFGILLTISLKMSLHLWINTMGFFIKYYWLLCASRNAIDWLLTGRLPPIKYCGCLLSTASVVRQHRLGSKNGNFHLSPQGHRREIKEISIWWANRWIIIIKVNKSQLNYLWMNV